MLTNLVDHLFPFGPFLRNVDSRERFSGWKSLFSHAVPLTFFIHWLFSFIPLGGLIYFLTFIPISAKKHIVEKNIVSKPKQYSVYLWYFIVVLGGYGNLRNFIGHFFLSDFVAERIGWAVGSPFQIELAFMQLGIAAASLYAIWKRENLVQGITIILSIFLWGAAYVHLKDIFLLNNFSPYNVGSVLVGDILIPFILIYLLIQDAKTK